MTANCITITLTACFITDSLMFVNTRMRRPSTHTNG